MKEKPIIFSTLMVQAILAGKKTQTRRIIKPQPDDSGLWNDDKYPRSLDSDLTGWNGVVDETGESKEFKFPYGQIGDILWVRETWNKVEDVFFGGEMYIYKEKHVTMKRASAKQWKWKPSIFMPKEACRIKLKITDIRVEWLNDITERDAKAEGMKESQVMGKICYKPSFVATWCEINGNDSWNKNPWVWCISFENI